MRRATTAVLVCGGLLLASIPGQAPAAASLYDASTDLPGIVTGPTPFTVTVPDEQVCRMTFEGQERTAAPWTFTYTPRSGRSYGSVDIELCDGTSDSLSVRSQSAFSVTPRLSSAEDGPITITVENATGEQASVEIRDPRGRKVASATIPPDGGAITFRSRSTKPLTRYTAEVAGGPYRMALPVDVMRGWNSYDRGDGWFGRNGDTLGNFPACSTVTWVYDDSRRPSRTSKAKVLEDITGALSRLSTVTGLTFVRSDDPSVAGRNGVISIEWKNLGSRGPAGMGGTRFASGNGQATSSGWVQLNTQDDWSVNDAGAGFGPGTRGAAGRGWLVIHELMHALGMDHTGDRTQVMAALNYGQHRLGRGDLAGLTYLYPAKGC